MRHKHVFDGPRTIGIMDVCPHKRKYSVEMKLYILLIKSSIYYLETSIEYLKRKYYSGPNDFRAEHEKSK